MRKSIVSIKQEEIAFFKKALREFLEAFKSEKHHNSDEKLNRRKTEEISQKVEQKDGKSEKPDRKSKIKVTLPEFQNGSVKKNKRKEPIKKQFKKSTQN